MMNDPAQPQRLDRTGSLRSFFTAGNGRLLRHSFLIAFLLVSGGLLTSGAVELTFRYDESVRSIRLLQQEMADGAASKIQQYIDSITQQLEMVSQTPELVTEGITESYTFLLHKLLRVSPAITTVTLLDIKGHEQLRLSRVDMVNQNKSPDDVSDQALVQAKTGASFFGPVYFVRQSEPYMHIAVPIELFAGEVIGVLMAEVNLTYIWEVISRIKVGQAGYAYVVSPEGDLIAHPDISLALQMQNLKHLSQVQEALSGRPSPSTQPNLQGEDVYTTHAPIPNLGWVVLVERLGEEAYGPLYASLMRLGFLLVLGIGIAGVASWGVVRRVLRPIDELRWGAEAFGAGALHHRITVETGDELQMLAETFNHMAEQLQAAHANLEHQVEVRTAELARSVAELELVSQHKSRFLAHMSHELRTPLNAIVGYTELMLDNAFGDIPDEARENLERVEQNSNHLLGLINAVLDFSRIEAGGYTLSIAEYSLRDLIESTVVALEHAAAAKQLTVTVTIPSELPIGRGDERRLAQVWYNLVGNAITYTDAGGDIGIEAAVLEGGVFRVAVTDTGPGIAPEDQARIFDPFEQAHASPTRVQSGTGLGLAICRTIIELHGGSIGVSSTPGQGATFWCTFPVRTADEKEL